MSIPSSDDRQKFIKKSSMSTLNNYFKHMERLADRKEGHYREAYDEDLAFMLSDEYNNFVNKQKGGSNNFSLFCSHKIEEIDSSDEDNNTQNAGYTEMNVSKINKIVQHHLK